MVLFGVDSISFSRARNKYYSRTAPESRSTFGPLCEGLACTLDFHVRLQWVQHVQKNLDLDLLSDDI